MQQLVESPAAQSLVLVRGHKRCLDCRQHAVVVHLQSICHSVSKIAGTLLLNCSRLKSLQLRSCSKGVCALYSMTCARYS